jgi:hypothetical protein
MADLKVEETVIGSSPAVAFTAQNNGATQNSKIDFRIE